MANMGDIRLGDYVAADTHGVKGRVFRIDQSFSTTGADEHWFQSQSPKLDEATRSERWINILCQGAGAVLVPESRVTLIPAFEFENLCKKFYFRD